jgi:glucosamine--fructose-6-phosphate aminotransferase (isomerizing)
MAHPARTAHPYYMHEAVLAQPQAFAESIRRNTEALEQVTARLATCGRLYLVGIGTSYHAVQVGALLLRAYAPATPVTAIHALDFALYGPRLLPADAVVVVSHRGNKRYSLAALQRAREAGCFTVLVTGAGETAETAAAEIALRTVANERSSAHTISYTSAIGILAALAGQLGAVQPGAELLPLDFLTETLPPLLQETLTAEPQMESLARTHAGRRRIWVAGGGPSAVTAQEIALKIKETAYVQAEGMSTEAMLHGPFQCTEAVDLFCLIAPAGPAQERTQTLAEQARVIGAAVLVVSDGTVAATQSDATQFCTVPSVPEPFTALTCLIPLQLFSYHLALARGTNPDGFRLEDPRFAQARQMVEL